jgi:hypothetical protein
MMIRKALLTFRLLKDYLKNVIAEEGVLVGIDALVQWDDDSDTRTYYLSFSKDPVYLQWDDFGVQDDDVFYYLDGIKEAISVIWNTHDDGWQIIDGNLVIAFDE